MDKPRRFVTIGAIGLRSRLWGSARPASRGAWLMLGGAFAAFTVSAGIMHSYAVFLVAFIEEFRWSRAETSIAYSVSQLVAGGSSPLVGALVDRLGPRRLLLLGGGLLVIGLLGSALISALWQIILLYGVLMTIGQTASGWWYSCRCSRAILSGAAGWRSRSSSRPTALAVPPRRRWSNC